MSRLGLGLFPMLKKPTGETGPTARIVQRPWARSTRADQVLRGRRRSSGLLTGLD